MDEIFKDNHKFYVFDNPLLTQRARPQEFIEAERRRIHMDPDHPNDTERINREQALLQNLREL